MADTIPYRCPQCGGDILKTSAEPHSLSDLKNSVCAKCGRRFSEDDLKSHAAKIMDKLIRDAFRRK